MVVTGRAHKDGLATSFLPAGGDKARWGQLDDRGDGRCASCRQRAVDDPALKRGRWHAARSGQWACRDGRSGRAGRGARGDESRRQVDELWRGWLWTRRSAAMVARYSRQSQQRAAVCVCLARRFVDLTQKSHLVQDARTGPPQTRVGQAKAWAAFLGSRQRWQKKKGEQKRCDTGGLACWLTKLAVNPSSTAPRARRNGFAAGCCEGAERRFMRHACQLRAAG